MDSSSSGVKVYRRLLSYVKPFWPFLVVAVLANILYSGVDAYIIKLLQPLLDKGFLAKDMKYLDFFPFMLFGLFVLRGIGSVASSYFFGYVSCHVVMNFRRQLFNHFLRLPASFFDQNTAAKLVSKIIYDVDQVSAASSTSFMTLVRETGLLIGLLVVMFWTSWQLTLLLFVVIPFVAFIVIFASRHFRRISRKLQNAMGGITHVSEESLRSYREIRINNGENYQKGLFDQVSYDSLRQSLKFTLINALNTPIIQVVGSIALSLVIYVSVRYIHLSAGGFVTMMTGMIAALKPLRNITNVNGDIQRGISAAQSVFSALDEVKEEDHGSEVINRAHGRVKFEHVSFCYPRSKKKVLDDICLDVMPGETIALVGRSGSGKSTLVSLLARFYEPSQGKIELDGHVLQNLKLTSLRQQIALVSQHVALFNDTILHNIAYSRLGQVSENDVIEAAKIAHAWEFIQQFPEGLNTLVGDNGIMLSGGQRQRLAIARALLKKAPVLILDEATSALDSESERYIQSALDELISTCTTFIIAHRLSTIEKADRIVVMDQGRIIESGSHEALLEKNGLYAMLHQQPELL